MLKTILIPIALTIATTHAATVSYTSTTPLSFNETYGTVTSPVVVFDSTFLSATVPAFDAALGTLTGVSITWTLAGSYSGVISGPNGGGYSSGYSGPFLINGISGVSGFGGGNGGGGDPGAFGATPFNSLSDSATQSFTVANAAILASVTGTEPVTLQWSTPLTITPQPSLDSLEVSGTATVSITYTYSAIPEASTLALGVLGLGSICFRRRRI